MTSWAFVPWRASRLIVKRLVARSKGDTGVSVGCCLVIGWKDNGELMLQMIQQGVQGVGVECGYSDGMVTPAEKICLRWRNPVTFVENKSPRNHIQIQILENFDHCGNLDVDVRGAGIDNVHQQVSLTQFF